MMIRVLCAFFVACLVVGLGCVQIPDKFEAHIVVEIRHQIENQAEQVLDYVEGRTDRLPDIEPVESNATSWVNDILHALNPVHTAYAQALNEDSPRVKQIAESMRARHAELEKLKQAAAVGETNRGYVELRPSDALADEEAKNAAQRLIAAENNDRKALYQEVARLNKDADVTIALVERAYAQKRLDRAKVGELFQLPPAGEDLEKFKTSSIGKKLGASLKPDAWVTIP
jgi:uncharacterized protein YdbL (DUF1318 family)